MGWKTASTTSEISSFIMPATVHWITTKAQAKAISHATRHDIIDRLTALGPMTVREMAEALGKQPTAIYRHLKVLLEVGLVLETVHASSVPGRPSTLYRAVADRVRFAKAVDDPKLRKTVADFARLAGNQVTRDYNAALGRKGSKSSGPGRNVWLFRIVTAPSPQKLKRMNELLDELAELAWTPDPNPGPLLSLAWFMSITKSPKVRKPRTPSGKEARR